MSIPDFSRLSLTTPTAAPGAAPSPAAKAVMSSHALIASILYNIRYENVQSVCEAVVNWCSVSSTHHQACDAQFYPALWKELAERVFPNLQQAVFPPLNSPDLKPFIAHFQFAGPQLTANDLPWSESPLAMSWRAWLFFLCDDHLRKRKRFRKDAASKKAARDATKRNARMHQERLDDFEERLESAHSSGGPPNQKIRHKNAKKLVPYYDALAQASRERKSAADALQDSRQRLWYHRQRYGRTADHKEHGPQQRLPAYGPTRGGGEDGPGAMNDFDDEVRENADTEDQWSDGTEGEDKADAKWDERYSDVAMSEAEDDDGVDGEAQ